MKPDHSSLLDVPVENIAASEEFLEMCKVNGFRNLNDIIEYPAYELLKKEMFGARMLKELYTILKAYNLQNKLKE